MIEVFIMCSGLGHIGRGYESFSRELFEELKSANTFDIKLVKGAGKESAGEYTAWCLQRNGSVAKFISRLTGIEAYDVEQISFFIFSIPLLLRQKPDVILYSDFKLGVFLWYMRKFLHLRYKLLFSNGAPNGPPFTRCDHVQQLLPCHYQTALAGGTPAAMQSIIPYGIRININSLKKIPDKLILRKELVLPAEKKIIISVGALNNSHKRMKYLVEEFTGIQNEGYFLIILGQVTEETPELLNFAKKNLDPENYFIKSVTSEEVEIYNQAADIFVLCSLKEGLPRVTIEAMCQGLPIIVHDYEITRETLQNNAQFADLTIKGSLQNAIKKTESEIHDPLGQKELAYLSYSWDALLPAYIRMIEMVAGRS